MVWRITPSNLLVDDPDALVYLAAVEAADGQALESDVRLAVNTFIKGCKTDGIWSAIKASCILAGARTREGAIVPLANASGVAPTFTGATGWSYNRKTGLKSDGTVKIVSGRSNNSDPIANKHLAVYVSENLSNTSLFPLIGGRSAGNDSAIFSRSTDNSVSIGVNCSQRTLGTTLLVPALVGGARQASNAFDFIVNGTTGSISEPAAATASSSAMHVFGQSFADLISNPRLAFYTFGEYLNLALLNTRVSTLMTDLATAIP